MRSIKFRAWDKERKEMLPITSMDWNAWWVSCEPILEGKRSPLDYGERNSFKNEETDRHIVMQYTGLTDRNGKEIYEGDIGEGEHAVYAISWDDTKAQFKAKIITTKSILTKNCSFPLWQYVEDDGKCRFEVIGNIYENPELLEVS